MAHVQDRWETTVGGRRVRTDRYGQGMRWRARYEDPDGNERSRMFARKQDAERFLTTITADVLRGAYVDPDAGKVTFGAFADGGSTLRPSARARGKHRVATSPPRRPELRPA